DSAYEILTRRAETAVDAAEAEDAVKTDSPSPKSRTRTEPAPARSQRQGAFEALAVSLLRTVGAQVGREIVRGVMGSLKKRR
ncbi:MAG: helicase HerA-like domain-containing protein, partial [Asticcacaulis sp.]